MDAELLDALSGAADAIAAALARTHDWGLAGTRPGQHFSDLATDEIAVEVLTGLGFGVLSEESGLTHADREIVVVVDPLDGSTNAARHLAHYATSLCAVDGQGPRAAVVVDLAIGERFSAVRGGGAWLDGSPISVHARPLADTVVAINGLPPRHLGWGQFRTLGAAALDICAVACGRLDAFIDCDRDAHGVWDYLGALLVCQEAGGSVVDAFDRDLVILDPTARRTPVAASTPELLDHFLRERRW